jgi:hypothetical protein
VAARGRKLVLVNVKMAETAAIDLARKAAAEGLTQKQFI